MRVNTRWLYVGPLDRCAEPPRAWLTIAWSECRRWKVYVVALVLPGLTWEYTPAYNACGHYRGWHRAVVDLTIPFLDGRMRTWTVRRTLHHQRSCELVGDYLLVPYQINAMWTTESGETIWRIAEMHP